MNLLVEKNYFGTVKIPELQTLNLLTNLWEEKEEKVGSYKN